MSVIDSTVIASHIVCSRFTEAEDVLVDAAPEPCWVKMLSDNAKTMRVKGINLIANQNCELNIFASGFQEARPFTSYKKFAPCDEEGNGYCILTSAATNGGHDGCMLAVSNFIPFLHVTVCDAEGKPKRIPVLVKPDHLQIVYEVPRF